MKNAFSFMQVQEEDHRASVQAGEEEQAVVHHDQPRQQKRHEHTNCLCQIAN